MDEDLQKAYKIIKKEFGRWRYKTVNSIDEIKLDEFDSPIVMYYHDKKWEHVHTILDICHHGNRFCDRCDKCDDIHRDEAFYIYTTSNNYKYMNSYKYTRIII